MQLPRLEFKKKWSSKSTQNSRKGGHRHQHRIQEKVVIDIRFPIGPALAQTCRARLYYLVMEELETLPLKSVDDKGKASNV